jgi:hypothetical protein
MGSGLKADELYAIGFRKVAKWMWNGALLSYEFDHAKAEQRPLMDVANALYAFCIDDHVLYIGKTTQSLRRRLVGYCKPGHTQATNIRCHNSIRVELTKGEEITILAFTPSDLLQFGGFEINLAAGLEDSLIRRFAPPWNGGRKGVVLTETAEMEAEQEPFSPSQASASTGEIGRFNVKLGETYYHKGIVNPGVDASHLLGKDDETLVVRFGDGAPPLATRIDRRANRTGAVRFVGSNQAIADWFQRNFRLDETVTARILGPNEVEFLAP